MIQGKSVLAVIPARGGSKGLPRKNIRELGGKPLIAWSIAGAAASRYIDRCVVSTDDEEIAAVAKRWGGDVPFLRPGELALDHTPGIDPILHALGQVPGYDIIVLLQPTSPLRTVEDIDGCIERLFSDNAPSCVTVVPVDKSPLWMYILNEQGRMEPLLPSAERNIPRQHLPKVHVLNGAVYAARTEWLILRRSFLSDETIAYIMPKERSIDIDTADDFRLAEYRLRQK